MHSNDRQLVQLVCDSTVHSALIGKYGAGTFFSPLYQSAVNVLRKACHELLHEKF